MALVAWWKLDGNALDSSGNGYHGAIVGDLPIIDNGKIGKTFGFANNENGINVAATNLAGLEAYTMCAWVKPLGNHRNYNGAIISSGNWNSMAWSFGLSQNNSQIDVASYWYNRYISHPVPVGEWTHILCTSQDNITKVYVNGTYIGQVSATSRLDSSAPNLCIGRETYASGYFSFNGNINDVRVYDHILSEKEVNELAKAKILHYKFDDFQEPTQNILGTITPSYSYSKWGTNEGTSTYFTAPNGNQGVCLEITSFTDGGVNWYNTGGQRNAEPSAQYTVSATIKYEGGTPSPNLLYLRQYRSNGTQISEAGQFSTSYIEDLGNGWYRAYRAFTAHAECAKFLIQGYEYKKIKIWIYDIQCEKKAYHTPYVANDRSGVVHDCSGYDNHAELELDISPRWTNDARIGSGAYSFNGDQAFKLEDTLPSPPDQVTVSAWVKTDDASVYQHVFSKSTNVISCAIYQSRMYCKFTIGGVNRNPRGSTVLQSNRWYHLVWLYDGKNIKFYIDGELDFTSPNYTGALEASDDPTFIGAEMSGATSPEPKNCMLGLIDDIRVYATALSDEDILELYQTRASLDDKGNLYAQEVNEKFNLLEPELFYKYANSGDPEYAVVEGRRTWSVYPARFHPNGALNGMFKPNTRYKIRTVTKHDTIHQGIYRPGGFRIRYTDETYTDVITTGGTGEWLTREVVSTTGKTISDIWVYYYTSYRVMVDIDESYLVEHSDPLITDSGTLDNLLAISELGPTNGLIAYYPLNGNANDYSGNNNHGTNNGATVTSGIRGSAYSFNGSSSYIRANNVLNQGDPFSISFWTKISSTSTQCLGCTRTATGNGMSIFVISNKLRLDTDHQWTTGYTVPQNEWIHVVLMQDTSGKKLYIDGELEDSTSSVGSMSNLSSIFQIGASHSNGSSLGNYLNGVVSDYRIYNRVLSPQEVKILFDVTKPNAVPMQLSSDGTVYLAGELREA